MFSQVYIAPEFYAMPESVITSKC